MKRNKKTILAVVLTLFSISVFAQKANVVTAYNYNRDFGRKGDCTDLVKGMEAIVSATTDAKTKDEPKTWYYGGNIFYNAYFAPEGKCRTSIENSLDKAREYYLNALKFNIEDGAEMNLNPINNEVDFDKLVAMVQSKDTEYDDRSYTVDIVAKKFPYIANAYANNGIEAYNAGNLEEAVKNYDLAISTSRLFGVIDTVSIYNSALAADRNENYDVAIEKYNQLTELGYGGGDLYIYLANAYQANGDTAQRIAIIQEGRAAYPDNLNLLTQELQYYLETGKSEEALKNFEVAIAKEPGNSALWYNRAFIYDQMGEYEKAAADYEKTLEIDPKNFDAAYNLGAMYYNQGVEWNNKANAFDISEKKKYDAARAEADKYFLLALPHLENALEINPEDKNTIASLLKIYAINGDTEKYKEMKAKLQ